MSMQSPYKILGLKENAPFVQVRKAYLELSKRCHPDINGATEENIGMFNIVISAYNDIKSQLKHTYAVFDLSYEADFEDVKLKYNKMIDEIRLKHREDKEKQAEEMERINNAFRFISSSVRNNSEEEW